jgi:hypothetical protein
MCEVFAYCLLPLSTFQSWKGTEPCQTIFHLYFSVILVGRILTIAVSQIYRIVKNDKNLHNPMRKRKASDMSPTLTLYPSTLDENRGLSSCFPGKFFS